MREPAEFDAFYAETRERLLVQCFALTGDLPAARRAVRDAYVVAWHHWRKVRRTPEADGGPEAAVRPLAWRAAARRHTARVFHRHHQLPADAKATLDALGKLSGTQRRALVLTYLAPVSMARMAEELGVGEAQAGQELQTGTSQLALLRDVPSASLPLVFDDLAGAVRGSVRWPRPTIVRRAGRARRRLHTGAGVAAAVAVALAAGALIDDPAGARPTLARENPTAPRPGASVPPPAPVVDLPESALLGADSLEEAMPARSWTVKRTFDNQSGTGLVLPCQTTRFADPDGAAALVRTFVTRPRDRTPRVQATQVVEASDGTAAAERTYRTTTRWFGRCADAGAQLVATRRPVGVGDDALQIVLRSTARPETSSVLGIARSGEFTTTVLTSQSGADAPDPAVNSRMLAAAVDELCHLDGGGACAREKPHLEVTTPVPLAEAPAMLGVLDLPRPGDVTRSWAASDPAPVDSNLAATRCDHESFTGRFQGERFRHGRTRTFLVPDAGLPSTFGLTETVGALPRPQAKALVAEVRSRLGSCEDKGFGTDVTRLVDRTDGDTSLAAWRLTVQVSDQKQISFVMAVVRNGTAVAQVGFVPAGQADLSTDAFVSLAQRALDRLVELPAPS